MQFLFLYFFNVSIDLFDWVSNAHNDLYDRKNCMCEVFLVSFSSFCVRALTCLCLFMPINTTSNNKSLHQVWYRLMRAHTRTHALAQRVVQQQQREQEKWESPSKIAFFAHSTRILCCTILIGIVLKAEACWLCAWAWAYLCLQNTSFFILSKRMSSNNKKNCLIVGVEWTRCCVFIIITPLACAARFYQNTNLSITTKQICFFACSLLVSHHRFLFLQIFLSSACFTNELKGSNV